MSCFKKLIILPALFLFFGCANLNVNKLVHDLSGSKLPYADLGVKFDEEFAKELLKDGSNSIKGSASIRLPDRKTLITQKDAIVYLIPATEYATKRLGLLFDDVKFGLARKDMEKTKIYPNPDSYFELMKKTTLDKNGNFSFEKVADGTYYVLTTIQRYHRGELYKMHILTRVSVNGGKNAKVDMKR